MVSLTRSLQRGIKFDCLSPGGCDGHCCWGTGSVYVFADDIARVAELLGEELDTFLDKHVDFVEWPPFHVKYDGKIPQLMFKEIGENARCHFQDEKGLCTVHDARPFQCSGYPFWKMNVRNKESWAKLAAACPAVKASRKARGARRYSAAEIKRLVQDEIDMDIAWEKAMAEWKGDYKGYLRRFMSERDGRLGNKRIVKETGSHGT
ncbi:MAG: YkgJ family cysteine cluster protein [Candidatus Lokiarchaeota archaeon]|nr:YkgJ family cysteine cluster protein [Candidatus Lokiarchaeota archaeon]